MADPLRSPRHPDQADPRVLPPQRPMAASRGAPHAEPTDLLSEPTTEPKNPAPAQGPLDQDQFAKRVAQEVMRHLRDRSLELSREHRKKLIGGAIGMAVLMLAALAALVHSSIRSEQASQRSGALENIFGHPTPDAPFALNGEIQSVVYTKDSGRLLVVVSPKTAEETEQGQPQPDRGADNTPSRNRQLDAPVNR